jgi:hypothetical protein
MQKSDPRPIVVGGYPGSGCLLLGRMLDANSQVRCGPPTGLFVVNKEPDVGGLTNNYKFQSSWLPAMMTRAESRAHFLQLFAGMARARAGARRWADCTPANVLHIETIFEWCPEAMFIHVVREVTDAVAAVCNSPSPDVRAEVNRWREWTEAGQQWREHPRYAEINYPVLRDEQSLHNLFVWLELPWEPHILGVSNGTGNMFVVNMVRELVEADESLSKLNAHL